MKKIILIVVMLMVSCASGPDYEGEHNDYLMSVKNARDNMSKVDFETWLAGQLKAKEQEFNAYGGLQERQGRILEQHEQRASESQDKNDVYEHQKQTSQIQMRRYHQKRKFLEKEIFLLRGLLATFDSPFVPKK